MRFIFWIIVSMFVSCGIGNGKTEGKAKDFHASFMPNNMLYMEDDNSKDVSANLIDEAYFNSIIAKAQGIYEPIVKMHGGNLNISGNWQDSTVNAFADRNGDEWNVSMFGGMARRNEITKEGFALVICHEIGHHLAGYPVYAGQWASNEGNSDYYATAGCATKLFGEEVEQPPLPTPEPKTPCYAENCKSELKADPTICQKSIDGALSLGKLLANLNGDRTPSLNTPDKTVVKKTQDAHPRAQCRLDTMYMGVLCSKAWNDSIIPRNKQDMPKVSCEARPTCWYKP